MMRAALLLLLLPATLQAGPRAGSKKAGERKAAPKVAPSTAAAGVEFPAYAASTAPVTLELVARGFRDTDARINTLKAQFKQVVRTEGSDTAQSVEGEVLFRKPDLMRLTHRLPEPQTIVSDGAWLWVHRRSTNQVVKTRLEAWRRSEPLARGLLDFGRSADLLNRYKTELTTVSAPGADGHRLFVLTLTPKPEGLKTGDSDFTLTLKASTRDFFPGEAALQVGRASIRSTFQDVRLDPAISDDAFRFEPPKDADLFESPEQRP